MRWLTSSSALQLAVELLGDALGVELLGDGAVELLGDALAVELLGAEEREALDVCCLTFRGKRTEGSDFTKLLRECGKLK